jgi:NADH-quinone oxidoreductase subunit E
MLSDQERREIETELTHYADKQAACIEALKVVQRHRGWVSDEHLGDIATLLGMSAAELDGVATFYSLIFRERVGRHVLLLCNSVSCWIMGYERVRAQLRDILGIDFGQTTQDGRFTFLPVPCLGACDQAPALMVGDDLHADVAPETLSHILERYR